MILTSAGTRSSAKCSRPRHMLYNWKAVLSEVVVLLPCARRFPQKKDLEGMAAPPSLEEDIELWDVIFDGPYVPTKDVKEGELTNVIPKTTREYDKVDRKKIKKNYKAKKLLGPSQIMEKQSECYHGGQISKGPYHGLPDQKHANLRAEQATWYLNLGTKHGHYGAKMNKATERTKKRRPEDRLKHWVSPGMILRCSTLSPKITEPEVAERQCRKAMNQTKGRTTEWIGDPD
ncbi:hypothetical protein MTR67_043568 [Solanum verrucosum]|uniref:Uncharacterized protein n=1 Tax=Solanum verrucosum TaxID=315347 RepID=A0AAF0UNZ3_SOLVR|nr:hypothetical protein MTR67_043568 [Solanum verrucosum]